ncbi:MAG: zinc-ribbon domain-containing protein, partial [Candidatus Thorarchaeota archaeon]
MIRYNYCPECGTSLSKEEKACPKCGARVDNQYANQILSPSKKAIPDRYPPLEYSRKRRSTVKKWGHLGWVFLLIGGGIGLYALFTPAGSINLNGLLSWDMWMFGYNKTYDWETGWDNFWTLNNELLGISVGSTIFVIIGNILAIASAGYQIKRGIHKSYLGIAGPVVAVGATLVYLAGYEIMFNIYMGESFWSVLPPAFGVYGQFLAALFMVLGFIIARSASKYQILKEKHENKMKLYLMLRMFIETGTVSEDEKEKLSSILKILELRFKGISLLENKIEDYSSKRNGSSYLEPMEFGEAIECFQQAMDLSPEHIITFSKRDLDLASRIILGYDSKTNLDYLNEIKSHTDFFLTELLLRYRY